MRILEASEISYTIEDIAEAIDTELGFSMIKKSDTEGYFILGTKIILTMNYSDPDNIELTVSFPSKDVDISDNTSRLELYATAIESVFQIRDLIMNMAGN